jgi:hypothetical protein
MGMLFDNFSKIVHSIGVTELKHPIFYNSPVGIRFEIGGEESVYLNDAPSEYLIANPEYISAAFDRAKGIYTNLPHKPNILRIDGYPDDSSTQKEIQKICQIGNMPLPHEQFVKPFKWYEDDETVSQLQLYWDLEKISFTPDRLLQEIIKADIGGYNGFVSNVYFADTHNSILFHLYDDRGADLVATDKEFLRPIYEKFNSWILDYDREKIDAIFIK